MPIVITSISIKKSSSLLQIYLNFFLTSRISRSVLMQQLGPVRRRWLKRYATCVQFTHLLISMRTRTPTGHVRNTYIDGMLCSESIWNCLHVYKSYVIVQWESSVLSSLVYDQ